MIFQKFIARYILVLGAALLFGSSSASAQGPGDLTVTPTRVTLEGRARSAQISLISRAAQTSTYRVSFTRIRMSEDGHFEEIQEGGPGELFADELIRYSPRQVTLEPGEAQTVRLMLRKPADLAFGEYRSHLLLHAVPTEMGNDIETAKTEGDDRELAVRLTPVYRVAVPVIVRHGELDARAELTDLLFEPGDDEDEPTVSFRLLRHGERSLYGDVSITFLSDHGGGAVEVGRLEGLAVYVPNPRRFLALSLRPPEGVALEKGRLKIVFSEDHGTGRAVAEGELPLS